MVAPHEAASAPERAHPRAGLLDERSRAHDTHSFPCTEVPDVVRDEPPCSCTDRCREDRHVLGVGQFSGHFWLFPQFCPVPVARQRQALTAWRPTFRRLSVGKFLMVLPTLSSASRNSYRLWRSNQN